MPRSEVRVEGDKEGKNVKRNVNDCVGMVSRLNEELKIASRMKRHFIGAMKTLIS